MGHFIQHKFFQKLSRCWKIQKKYKQFSSTLKSFCFYTEICVNGEKHSPLSQRPICLWIYAKSFQTNSFGFQRPEALISMLFVQPLVPLVHKSHFWQRPIFNLCVYLRKPTTGRHRMSGLGLNLSFNPDAWFSFPICFTFTVGNHFVKCLTLLWLFFSAVHFLEELSEDRFCTLHVVL